MRSNYLFALAAISSVVNAPMALADYDPIYSLEAAQIVDDSPLCTKVLSATGTELVSVINRVNRLSKNEKATCQCPIFTFLVYDSFSGHIALTKMTHLPRGTVCPNPNNDPDYFDRMKRHEQWSAMWNRLYGSDGN